MESQFVSAQVAAGHTVQQIYVKHSLSARLLHWANVVVIAVLVWTAFLLLSGTPELSWSHWFSPRFYAALHLDHRNDEGRVWHVLFSFIMIAVGVLYAICLATSRQWKNIIPTAASWKDAYLVVLHDLGLKSHHPLQVKYNGAQRIAYTAVILMGLGEIVTGLPIYFKDWAGLANALGGQTAIRLQHFLLMLGILAFVVVHVIQVVRAGWNNFRAMIIGLEVVHEDVDARPGIVQALAEPDRVAQAAPTVQVESEIHLRSRRGFTIAALTAVVVLGFGAFAHTQSKTPDRVPVWLNWARDVEPNSGNPQKSSHSGATTTQEHN